MKNYIKSFLFFGLLLVSMFPSFAQALTISPLRIELTGDPGAVVTKEFSLANEEDEDRTYSVEFANIESSGESGAPSFLKEKEGLAIWMETDTSVTLKPKERKVFNLTVKIPKDASAGGYASSLLWKTDVDPKLVQTGNGAQVYMSSKVAILVFLRVNGDIVGDSKLLEFGAKNKFVFSLPVDFFWRFGNQGGDRIVPQGNIIVKNLFGETIKTLEANHSRGGILPGGKRIYNVPWLYEGDKVDDGYVDPNKKKVGFFGVVKQQLNEFYFGRYSAELDLSYKESVKGSKEGIIRKVNGNFNFYIIPAELTITSLVLLFFLFIGIKKYNSFIRGNKN